MSLKVVNTTDRCQGMHQYATPPYHNAAVELVDRHGKHIHELLEVRVREADKVPGEGTRTVLRRGTSAPA